MKRKLSILFLSVCAAVVIFLIGADAYKSDYAYSEKNAVAMGTLVSARIYGGDTDDAQKIITLVENTEKEISRHIEGSAVYILNKTGKAKVNGSIEELFNLCFNVSSDSSGAFDITTGGLTSLWDIGGENQHIPSAKEIKKELKLVDYASVKTKNGFVTIKPGQTVDLGAAGKGYACSLAYKTLSSSDIKGAVISVGGSILLYGKHNRPGDSWSVAVRNPFGGASDYAGIVSVDSGFVSTSGDYERCFEKDGKRYHHILSPFDGYPVESELSGVTVICNDGSLSDILSTACFVLGTDEGMKLINKYNAQAIFIDKNRNITITPGLKDTFSVTGDDFKVSVYEKN